MIIGHDAIEKMEEDDSYEFKSEAEKKAEKIVYETIVKDDHNETSHDVIEHVTETESEIEMEEFEDKKTHQKVKRPVIKIKKLGKEGKMKQKKKIRKQKQEIKKLMKKEEAF